jgi:tetratricopeptide (TPR) repeat protein
MRGSEPAHAASSAPPASAHAGFSSPLAALIDEFSRGQERERACALRLSAALHEELSGNVQQAIAILHDLTAHMNDPRIRAERDRLQSLTAKATSGIYRSHALKAERASRHKEAAESWGKVLEACPDDAEAALHAASCSMELGDLKRAGTYARKAAELAPESVAAHRLLWRFFRKAGMEHSAIREREILRKLSKGG